MQSITRDAYFGLVGIVILGVVVWLLVTQAGLGGGGQANGEAAPAEPVVSVTDVPTLSSPDAPTPNGEAAAEGEVEAEIEAADAAADQSDNKPSKSG